MTSATVTAGARATVRSRRLKLPRIGLHAFLIATAIVWLAPVAWAPNRPGPRDRGEVSDAGTSVNAR